MSARDTYVIWKAARAPQPFAASRVRVAMRIPALVLLAVWCCSCGPSAVAPEVEAPPVALVSQEEALSGWAAVRATLIQRAGAEGVSDLGLMVFDRDDTLVFQHMLGGFTPQTRVAVASASKLVSGIVLFEVVKRGQLSLDSTTGAVLGWTGPKAGITLRHLLSFTSGLPPDHACLREVSTPLASCVAMIGSGPLLASPGTRYDYGGTHLQVAARMAEVRTGKTWNALFSEILRAPLGQPSAVNYFTLPKAAVGTLNPLVGGGLQASMAEYSKYLALAYHKGQTAGLTVGTTALFDAQGREPYPNVVVGSSPMADLGYPSHYGLTAWLECATPALGCARYSSPGAFGFTPWLDRTSGYYAILGMELNATAEGGVGAFSYNLERDLAPLIRDALAP
jgi:serine-type D-Ala-D-Ala carboxypeptidase/endopeptidase